MLALNFAPCVPSFTPCACGVSFYTFCASIPLAHKVAVTSSNFFWPSGWKPCWSLPRSLTVNLLAAYWYSYRPMYMAIAKNTLKTTKWRHGSEAVIGLSTSANVASLCSVPNDRPQTVDSGDLGCFSSLFEGEKVVGHFPRRT